MALIHALLNTESPFSEVPLYTYIIRYYRVFVHAYTMHIYTDYGMPYNSIRGMGCDTSAWALHSIVQGLTACMHDYH